MQENQNILRRAAKGRLPDPVDENSGIDMDLFEELYNAGLVQAIDACSDDGRCYMEPKITLAGRAALASSVGQSEPWWCSFDRRIAVWGLVLAVVGIVVALVVARAT